MYILRNCHFVKELTEGTDLERGDVLIAEGQIERIAPCGELQTTCTELDLKGSTLLPGLIDAHVHLHYGGNYSYLDAPTAGDRVFDCIKFTNFLLSQGITTVRDMGDEISFPTIAVKKAIREGTIVGPNIQTAGITIAPLEAGFQVAQHMTEHITGPIEMRRSCRKMLMNGADVIKIYGTGSVLTAGSEPGLRILEEDEILAAVEVANRKNTYVACHCHGAEAIPVMIRCGVRTIEHASLITDETCKMLDGRTDVGIVPTVGLFADECFAGEPPRVQATMRKMREHVFDALRNAGRYNILMGWGTDTSLSVYQAYPYIEWKIRKEKLGYSNIELLKQATINSAKLMMMDQKIGSIKEGKLADLIVVDGDPVANIEVMYKQPVHIFKNGKLIQ